MVSTLRLVRRHRQRLWPLFTVCLVAGVVFLFQDGTFGQRPCPMDGIFLTDAPDDWLLQGDDRNGCQWTVYVDGRPAAADLYDDLPPASASTRPAPSPAGPQWWWSRYPSSAWHC